MLSLTLNRLVPKFGTDKKGASNPAEKPPQAVEAPKPTEKADTVTITPVAPSPATPVATPPATPVATPPATPVATSPAPPVAAPPTTPVATPPATPVATPPATPVATHPATPVDPKAEEKAKKLAEQAEARKKAIEAQTLAYAKINQDLSDVKTEFEALLKSKGFNASKVSKGAAPGKHISVVINKPDDLAKAEALFKALKDVKDVTPKSADGKLSSLKVYTYKGVNFSVQQPKPHPDPLMADPVKLKAFLDGLKKEVLEALTKAGFTSAKVETAEKSGKNLFLQLGKGEDLKKAVDTLKAAFKDFNEKAKGDIAYKLKEAKLYIREHKDPQPIKHVVQKDDKKPATPAATPPATPAAPAAPPAAQTPPPAKK